MRTVLHIVLLCVSASAISSRLYGSGDGLMLKLVKFTNDKNHFSLDPYVGLLCPAPYPWRMAESWYGFLLFPGELLHASPWVFRPFERWSRSLCSKSYPLEMQHLLAGAVQQGFRLQAVLENYGVPLVMRTSDSDVGQPLTHQTRFVPGVPLGSMVNGQPLVYSHIDFYVHYALEYGGDAEGLRLLGVEAVPGKLVPIAEVVDYSYEVAWTHSNPSFASYFPGGVVITHSEWFPAANTYMVLFSLLCTVFALCAFCLPLSQTEEQVKGLVGRHIDQDISRIPVHFVLYYLLAAVALFCSAGALSIILATLIVFAFQISQFYRHFTLFFPALALAVAFMSGYSALSFCGMVFKRWPSLKISSMLSVSALFLWLATGVYVGFNMWAWRHPLLLHGEVPSLFLDSGRIGYIVLVLVVLSIPAIWLGASFRWTNFLKSVSLLPTREKDLV